MNDSTIQTTPASRREGTVMGHNINRKRLLAAAIAIVGLAGGAVSVNAATFSEVAAPAALPPAAFPTIVPTCTADCAITLNAGTGSVTVQDALNGSHNVPFYGFGVGANPPSLAGSQNSTIKVPEGTTLTITLTQSGVGGPIDLSFPSLAAEDVSNAGDVYTVHATKVGTSVFQPGSNPDAPKQIAMGLVGVLIVTPTGCASTNLSCAFDAGVSYTDEALVATTDLDPEFAGNPADFDMGYFGQAVDPQGSARIVYHVVNGKSFPDTDVIDVHAGDSVLVRSVNAGVTDKSMSLLGLRQTLLGRNASAYVDPQTLIAPLVGPGETADIAVQIPASAPVNQRYALIDAGRQMNHGNSYGFGGALTFFNVWPPAPPVAASGRAPVDPVDQSTTTTIGSTTTTIDPTPAEPTTTTSDPTPAGPTTTDAPTTTEAAP
jgi:hypothetical protein